MTPYTPVPPTKTTKVKSIHSKHTCAVFTTSMTPLRVGIFRLLDMIPNQDCGSFWTAMNTAIIAKPAAITQPSQNVLVISGSILVT